MKTSTIRRLLWASFILLAILPLLLLGGILARQNYSIQQEQLHALQDEFLNSAAAEINGHLHEFEVILLSTIRTTDFFRLTHDQKKDVLTILLHSSADEKHQRMFRSISLLDDMGHEQVRVSRKTVYTPADLRDLTGSDAFRIPAKTGKVYYGAVFFEEMTGEPSMSMSIPMPEFRSGNIRGVLVADMNLNYIWDVLADIHLGLEGTVYLLDRNGRVIAHPNPSFVLKETIFNVKEDGFMVAEGISGEKSAIASKHMVFGDQTFTIVTEIPFAVAFGYTARILTTIMVFVLLSLASAVGLGVLLVRRIVKPIESLSATALEIRDGDYTRKARIIHDDEIGVLAHSFNAMTARMVEAMNRLHDQIVEVKRVSDENRRQNILMNNILNSLTHPFYTIDVNDYTIRLANAASTFSREAGKSTCYALTHNSGQPCDTFDHPCPIAEIRKTGKPVIVEHIHNDPDGTPKYHEIHGYPIFNDEGDVEQIIEYNIDITDRKRAEDALHESEERNRTITTTAMDAIIMVNDEGKIVFWNPAAETIFGYTAEEVIGKDMHALLAPERYHDDYEKGMKTFRKTGTGTAIGRTIELTARKKDGPEFEAELSLSAIQVKGRWKAIGIVRDITERKKAERKILATLEEKDVLLREVHHRVKNNMQVISSLLDLQTGYRDRRPSDEMLGDLRNRIRSMALVHEKLYLSHDLTKVDFQDYVDTLVSNLYKFYSMLVDRVSVNLDIEDISLGIDTAIPCGLVINELVMNSLKYAFPDDRKGEIRIMLRKAEDAADEYDLTVSDNGIGIPVELDLADVKTLGLHLVKTLVEHQLRGTIIVNRDGGTEFRIRFRELRYKQRI